MPKVKLDDATAAQLRHHAGVVLGLDGITEFQNRKHLIAKIQQAAPDTAEIDVADAAPANPAADRARELAAEVDHSADPAIAPQVKVPSGLNAKQAAAHHHDPKIEVRIPSSREVGGDRDVQVAVNGVAFLIRRNTWTEVPYRVYLALENAVETLNDPVNDPTTGQLSIEQRNVHAYDFSSRNGPSQAEIDEWMERTQAVELA